MALISSGQKSGWQRENEKPESFKRKKLCGDCWEGCLVIEQRADSLHGFFTTSQQRAATAIKLIPKFMYEPDLASPYGSVGSRRSQEKLVKTKILNLKVLGFKL